QIHSVAALNLGSQLYFGMGSYVGGGPYNTGVPELTSGTWIFWKDSAGLFDPTQGWTAAPGVGPAGRFGHLPAGGKLFTVRAGEGKSDKPADFDPGYEPQLRTDSKGRLYVGNGSGLTVYDTTGTGFKEIAARRGLDCGRFGIAESGSSVTVYFMRFRDKAIVG